MSIHARSGYKRRLVTKYVCERGEHLETVKLAITACTTSAAYSSSGSVPARTLHNIFTYIQCDSKRESVYNLQYTITIHLTVIQTSTITGHM